MLDGVIEQPRCVDDADFSVRRAFDDFSGHSDSYKRDEVVRTRNKKVARTA